MSPFAAAHAYTPDPLTFAWLTATALLLLVVVAVPLLRTLAAGALLIAAFVTRRDHLRTLAFRVMPRIAHLIGGLVIGTAAVSAPAFAAIDERPALASVNLDRDAGARQSASTPAAANGVNTTMSQSASSGGAARSQNATAKPTHDPEQQQATGAPSVPARSADGSLPASGADQGAKTGRMLYAVRTGDTLWDIADAHLDHATNAEITEAWRAIWRANRAVIGDDPGLILPGQRLDLEVLS